MVISRVGSGVTDIVGVELTETSGVGVGDSDELAVTGVLSGLVSGVGVAEGPELVEGVGVAVPCEASGETVGLITSWLGEAGSLTVVLASLTAIAVQLKLMSAGAGLFNTIVKPSKLLLLTR